MLDCIILYTGIQQVNSQNQKLEKIDNSMQKATEKQTVVNARQRYLLK